MFLTGILSWWYSGGLVNRLNLIKQRLAKSADFFSIGLLLKTLFSPFRQISAGRVDGSFSIVVRAFFDRLLSRIIGATVRSFMIIFGTITLLLETIGGILMMLAWLLIPILPVVGIILVVIGVKL